MNEPEKDPSYYRSLPYAIEILPSSEGGFVAHHPALPGCAVEGDDLIGTLAALDEGRDLWIRAKLEAGEPIPEPAAGEPSGRLMLRVPIRLHQQLDSLARDYGKSLNRMTSELLLNCTNALPPWYGLGERTSAGEAADARRDAYAYWLTPQPEGGYVAEHPDLPGCAAAGDDPEEAMEELQQARELWLEARQEAGLEEEPEPLSARHSGTIHLRMPPELHADLIQEAKRNEVSLNQMMIFFLANAVGEMRARAVESEELPGEGLSVEQVPQALLLFQRGDRAQAERLLEQMPSPQRHFTLGLAEFAAGNFLQAMVHFTASYDNGLDFTGDGVKIYRATPQAPSVDDLFKQLLPFFHHSGASKAPAALALRAWIERMRGNYEEEARILRELRAA